MKYVGAHVSATNGVSNAPLNARAIGAEAFALFTRNPSRWHSAAISAAECEAFKRIVPSADIRPTAYCRTTAT